MDPFHHLASELRTMILLELPTRSDIIRASHASPILFRQRSESRLAIARGFLRRDLPGSLMQDAVAIVTFPDPTDVPTAKQTLIMDAHLRQWAQKDLQDPLKRHAPGLLLSVDALVLRLKLFIADYIAKATSTYLPLAYASLPDWAHASFSKELTSPEISRDGLGLTALTELKRYRLMRAFLRLSAYENESEEPSDPEMLQCVHEYLRTLYGALTAGLVTPQGAPIELSQGSYPVPADPTERQRGRMFPDDLQFDPEQHMEDWDASSIFGIRHTYIDRLAGCGFDLALTLLTEETTSCSLFLERCYDEVTFRHPERAPFGCRLTRLRDDQEPTSLLSDLGSGLWRSKFADFHSATRDDSLHHAFRRTYRQRAWAFFDDERLYSNNDPWHLPSYPLFLAEEARLQSQCWDTNKARRRALGYVPVMRMALFQSSGREVLDNNGTDYPALVEKIEDGFWMREMDECPSV
ncbi:hypothetical protein QQX98_000769 [Neonectria punicea]|uniref:Uncharacterized protein n=1 Tax=Neonectria punicea TaxID=979145 RepID=A0ABR1HRP8_9HYPO